MSFLLDILTQEVEKVHRIAAHATQTPCPDFGDLWWDPIDLDAVLNDPGVKFETASRMFVVARINGELRYFAGAKDIYEENYDYELGVFGTLSHALAFAEAYLIAERELREIDDERDIREARLGPNAGSGISRSRSAPSVPPISSEPAPANIPARSHSGRVIG
jgi:hypothetical protein